MDYHKIKWRNYKQKAMQKGLTETIKDIRDLATRNNAKYAEKIEMYRSILKMTASVYGVNSNVYKYMQRNPPDRPTSPENQIRSLGKCCRVS